MLLLMAPPTRSFAEAVQQVLDERGLTLRSQRQRTGLAHSTILTWLQGVRPRMEAVIQWANGFGLDVNEWLELAGYARIETREPPSRIFWTTYGDIYDRLRAEGIDPIVPTHNEERLATLTPDEARAEAEAYERRSREKHAAK